MDKPCYHHYVRRPTGSTDPISRRTGQWLQLRLLDMRSEETDMDDYEYYESVPLSRGSWKLDLCCMEWGLGVNEGRGNSWEQLQPKDTIH